jgi:alanine dehydrogenase
MNVGIPKEIKAQENRVSMIPGCVADLVKKGHRVFLERGAGEGASYGDEQYLAVGAEIAPNASALFAQAELIVKVKEPREPVAHREPGRHRLHGHRLRDDQGEQPPAAPGAHE